MKRTPLKRETPMRRTKMKRSRPKANPAGSDPKHLAAIRRYPCCVCFSRHNVEAHHSTVGRGLSQKTSDHETIPLCRVHHREFHDAKGFFDGWDKAERKDWQRTMVNSYRPASGL